MTQPLVPAPIVSHVSQEDVRATLLPLPSGRYPSRVLYDLYAHRCRSEDRTPGHVVNFGKALREYGASRCSVRVDGKQVNAWEVSNPMGPGVRGHGFDRKYRGPVGLPPSPESAKPEPESEGADQPSTST